MNIFYDKLTNHINLDPKQIYFKKQIKNLKTKKTI